MPGRGAGRRRLALLLGPNVIGDNCTCECQHIETKPPCRRCYGALFIRQPDGTLAHVPVEQPVAKEA